MRRISLQPHACTPTHDITHAHACAHPWINAHTRAKRVTYRWIFVCAFACLPTFPLLSLRTNISTFVHYTHACRLVFLRAYVPTHLRSHVRMYACPCAPADLPTTIVLARQRQDTPCTLAHAHADVRARAAAYMHMHGPQPLDRQACKHTNMQTERPEERESERARERQSGDVRAYTRTPVGTYVLL